MTRHVRVPALAVVVAMIVRTVASAQVAQSDLFFEIATSAPQAAASAGVLGRVVGMRLDRLFDSSVGPARTIRLNIDARDWLARFERQDLDAAGFRSWVGSLEGVAHSHVVFTERNGIVSGLINALSSVYQVRTLSQGVYVLEQLEADAARRELDPQLRSDSPLFRIGGRNLASGGWDDDRCAASLYECGTRARGRAGADRSRRFPNHQRQQHDLCAECDRSPLSSRRYRPPAVYRSAKHGD